LEFWGNLVKKSSGTIFRFSPAGVKHREVLNNQDWTSGRRGIQFVHDLSAMRLDGFFRDGELISD
jgi:hypothetical protein